MKPKRSASQISSVVAAGSPATLSEILGGTFPLSPEILQSKENRSLFVNHSPVPVTHDKSSIGHVIRMMRKEKGLSQEELAQKTHIDRTTIARVECGIFKTLSIEKLEGIATALRIDLKALLLKGGLEGEALTLRGHVGCVEFTIEYPEAGFRFVSLIPKRKELFFGRIELRHQKTIISSQLPHPDQIYLHCLEGKLVLIRDTKEFLLKPGDSFAFPGFSDYEIYNPDQLKEVSAFFITYPSFLPV